MQQVVTRLPTDLTKQVSVGRRIARWQEMPHREEYVHVITSLQRLVVKANTYTISRIIDYNTEKFLIKVFFSMFSGTWVQCGQKAVN